MKTPENMAKVEDAEAEVARLMTELGAELPEAATKSMKKKKSSAPRKFFLQFATAV